MCLSESFKRMSIEFQEINVDKSEQLLTPGRTKNFTRKETKS